MKKIKLKKTSRFAQKDRLQNVTREDSNNLSQNNIDVNKKNIDNKLNGSFGMTADVMTEAVVADIERILQENNVGEDEFTLEDIKVYGSYATGDASTIMHELAHWFLAKLEKYSKQYNNLEQENPRLYQEMQAIRKFLKNDGGRFTVAQHEKFARAFEVYIRNGWAPNNKLRQVFEYFKNALLSIYENLKSIVWQDENGNDKTFDDEELKNLKAVFDNIFTSERERIQAKVFDKVNE